jgi:hypothetical protein
VSFKTTGQHFHLIFAHLLGMRCCLKGLLLLLLLLLTL